MVEIFKTAALFIRKAYGKSWFDDSVPLGYFDSVEPICDEEHEVEQLYYKQKSKLPGFIETTVYITDVVNHYWTQFPQDFKNAG